MFLSVGKKQIKLILPNGRASRDGVQVYKLSPHTFDVIRLLKNAGQVNDSFILQPLCDAVDKIIDYCIRRFNRDVTTPELKIVVTDDIPGHWTFSPGLVRIKASLKLEPMFEAVIHAVARHWTVKMTNYETAADIWFEEGKSQRKLLSQFWNFNEITAHFPQQLPKNDQFCLKLNHFLQKNV